MTQKVPWTTQASRVTSPTLTAAATAAARGRSLYLHTPHPALSQSRVTGPRPVQTRPDLLFLRTARKNNNKANREDTLLCVTAPSRRKERAGDVMDAERTIDL